MKVALAVALAAVVFYFVDQHFYGGHYTDPVMAMLRDMKHGFGY